MERKTKKKLLVILMIIIILATDFFVLSSGIKTYASQLNSETDNANIEFSAYFKNGETKVDSIETSIKAEDVKLYAEIKVKNEGYLSEGTVIELENSNFNLKSEILPSNTHINSIEGNKVNLKQINSGETIEIELGIEPIITDKITTDFLSKTSTVKMIGVYVYSKAEEGQSIRSDKWVSVNYQPDETTNAELNTEIITNRVFSVNGTNQRIIQLLVKSRITNNEYPVKQTTLNVSIPNLSENMPEVETMAINETTKIENVTTENGIVNVTLTNEANENNEVNWSKNVYDEIVITYIYPENTDASKVEISTDSEIELYNSENTYRGVQTATIENEEPNNIIIGRNEIITEEMYKGYIYANAEEEYNTKTSIIITNENVADEIVMHEGPDVFGTDESELPANTRYISTTINLENMLEILGQDGNITIKNGDTTTTINKDTEVDENGNVAINYENSTSELDITTSKPVTTGILVINHTKIVTGNGYTRTQLQTVKTLNTINTISGTLEGTKILENATETSSLELKETTTKAELTIENNKQTLSTTELNEVTLGITLVTNGPQYDLYKNSRMVLRFPTAVENVELITAPSKQNADELTVSVGQYNATNKTLQINVQGEQTTYPSSELTQGYIQLNLNVTLNSLALAQTDRIVMAYTNENAIQYDGGETYGVAEQTIQISAPSQLIKRYNLSSNNNTSLTETILQRVRENQVGETLDFEISLTNNKDTDISNVRIIGKLPTTENKISGQDVNTLETTLRGISAENASIYYTGNASATLDLNNESNGWTQNLSSIENAKLYLIQVDSIERGENYTAHLEVEQGAITGNGISYTQYGVAYDTISQTGVTESSRKIGLATSVAASLKTEITAQVGQDILENGDIVKEGEVIKYTVTVRNNGVDTLENVQLNLDVPEGATYVRPIPEIVAEDGTIIQDGYVYADGYYEEVTESEQLEELTTITISQLTTSSPYIAEYEVRVNKGTANTQIINKSTVMYDETEVGNTEVSNTVQEANVRVTIKRAVDESIQLYAGGTGRYTVYVENLSNETINNLEMEMIFNGFTPNRVEKQGELLYEENVPEIITIDEISANSKESFYIQGLINNDATELKVITIVSDSNRNTYRSNEIIEELPYTDATISLSSPQNGESITTGDIVEYNITARNTGEIIENIGIITEIPDIFQIQSIYINDELNEQCIDESDTETYKNMISNTIHKSLRVDTNETITLRIVAKVGYVPDIYNGKIVTNIAEAYVYDALKDSSEMVSYILKSQEVENENVENIISGFAWFDANENGQKDSSEEMLQDITVQIYDINANDYLKDEDGNIIQAITDEYGQYTFLSIENGNYLVVFEYDTEKYVLTTPFAENVDTSINSKATIKRITGDVYINRVAAIEINNLNGNMLEMNIGLKENTGETPIEEQPGIEEIPVNPENPDDSEEPTNPDNPTEPENPDDPDNPTEPDDPAQPTDTKTISGYAWLDENINGKKDSEETYLSGIKVRLYDVSTQDYLKDENGNIIEVTTDSNGRYILNNIEKGSYIVLFEYDTDEYKLTNQSTNIVLKNINIDGQEITVAVTDTINVQNNISNINIGLRENLKFDLELNKYISKIVAQTSKETKSYEYDGQTLGKVEINKNQIRGANIVLEYTIKIKNTGEIAGYASNIVDYLPSGLMFSSELNSDWYLSGNNLYTKSLENTIINPGEEKEVKLILTKTMTENNLGLVNNRAEIYQDYNQYGESDIDSTPNNQAQDEDDFGTTDVIIQIATGGTTIAYILLALVNLVLIGVAIKIMIMNDVIKIKTKEERR